MRIALIGDIHANLPALQAVLNHAQSQTIDQVWNSGDSVGYGPFPEEVIQFLMASEVISIRGNYDTKVLDFERKNELWKKKKRHEKWLAFQFAFEHLSPTSRRYLQSLPEEITLKREGWRILLTHGSPGSPEEHLTPHTPVSRLEEITSRTNADIILCGHSHIPFNRLCGQTRFINPGSVGRPDDGDPRASYAILEITPQNVSTRHYRIPYDIASFTEAIHQHGLPEGFAQMAVRGYSLDKIIQQNEISESIS